MFIFKSNKLPRAVRKTNINSIDLLQEFLGACIVFILDFCGFNFYQTTDWELAVLSVYEVKQTR